jgi:L-fuconolactonase
MNRLKFIDSHQHFWDINRFKYEWMSPEDTVLYRDFLPASFGKVLHQNGIEKSVAVQAHQSLAETFWLLELAEEFDFIAGVVGWADLLSDEFEKQLDELAKFPKLKGIRHIVQDEPEEDWIIKPKVLANLGKLAVYHLTYDILIFPRHLPYIPTVIENCPNVKFVIDHLAKPFIKTGEIEQWKKDLKKIADFPAVFCKLSGLVTEADYQNWTVEDLRPYAETALELFGAERLMFGSDYPVCLLAADYQRVLETYQSFLKDLNVEKQQQVMQENAIKFYSLQV